MPSLLAHFGLALLLAVALLGQCYSRRTLALIVLILVLPEIDTILGLVIAGAHRTLFHNLVIPALVAIIIAWDSAREDSWLRSHFGSAGVRVAWTAVFVHTFTHLLLDWTHLEGINLLWPIHDQFFQLEGELYLSTADGVVQTFVELIHDPATGEPAIDAGGGGSREETHVANPVQPTSESAPDPTERQFLLVNQGWQLYLLLTGLFAVAAKRLQSGLRSTELE